MTRSNLGQFGSEFEEARLLGSRYGIAGCIFYQS